MKAALAYKKGFKIENIDVPKGGGNDVLLKVKSCGICGSDVKAYIKNEKAWDGNPKNWGHEISGVVEDVGELVEGLRPGDKVAADPVVSCGQCRYCRSGYTNICINAKVIGYSLPGGFAEYVLVKADCVFKIGENTTFNHAAFSEPLACAYYSVSRSRSKPGETAVVIGPGPIGLAMCIQLKSRGLKVILAGTRAERLRAAEELGVDGVIDMNKEDPIEKIKESTDAAGADVVIEAVGKKATIELAVLLGSKHSRIVFFGAPLPEETLTLSPLELIFKDQEFIFVCGAPSWAFPLVIDQLDKGLIKVDPVITHCFSLDQMHEGMETAMHRKGGAIKVMIKP